MMIRSDDNATVVIVQEVNPKGTQVFGPVAQELRQLNFTKNKIHLFLSNITFSLLLQNIFHEFL